MPNNEVVFCLVLLSNLKFYKSKNDTMVDNVKFVEFSEGVDRVYSVPCVNFSCKENLFIQCSVYGKDNKQFLNKVEQG